MGLRAGSRCRADHLAQPQPQGHLAPVLRCGECWRARGLPGGCCLHTEGGCSLGAQAGWRTAGWEARGRRDLGLETTSAHSRSLLHLSSWRRPDVGEAAGAELLQRAPLQQPDPAQAAVEGGLLARLPRPQDQGCGQHRPHSPRLVDIALPGGGWT
uniref:Protein FAM201A n=1 Tax=Homo sapiens TaxID=9606 RepID=F201A_HUMAN|nr:RecName: Full=Protein FAM201A [Homo sapiens]